MEKTWSDECTTRQPQVSVTIYRIYVNSQRWKGTNELLRSSWAIRNWLETWGRIACCLQDDIWCLKHAQTFPHLGSNILWNRRVQPLEIVCATEMFDLKESLIMRVTRPFGQLWWMIVPVRARVQAIGKVIFERESMRREVAVTGMIHEWPDRIHQKKKKKSSSHERSKSEKFDSIFFIITHSRS